MYSSKKLVKLQVPCVNCPCVFLRLGLAATLMRYLEDISEQKRCYFVDLFVRVTNTVAVAMYRNLGYHVFRRIKKYYTGPPDEDAYDMRKSLSRDKDKLAERPCEDDDFPLEDVSVCVCMSVCVCACACTCVCV